MLEPVLATYLPLALALWAAVYASDYYLTLYVARLYRDHAQQYIVFEGSIELTPYYQGDIDGLRRISPRFVRALVLSSIVISVFWLLSTHVLGMSWPFSLLMGGLLLREAVVHLRHVRNIALFRSARHADSVQGRIAYSRKLMLGQSATELFSFAALFLFISLVLGSGFVLGGALACAVSGVQHRMLRRRLSSAGSSAAEP